MAEKNAKKPFRLQPGEKMPQEMIDKLNQVKDNYKKGGDFSQYLKEIGDLFGVQPVQITEKRIQFLGGFVEGEASINVSVKKLATAQFGVLLDPEFSITQHANGFSSLYLALCFFRTGRIIYKTGSNATLVLIIDNRQSLEEKVVPFFEKYVKPYGSVVKAERLENFIKLLEFFKKDGHKNLKVFRDEMLPIWDSMRMQKGQSNQTFTSLEEAQQFVTAFALSKAITPKGLQKKEQNNQ